MRMYHNVYDDFAEYDYTVLTNEVVFRFEISSNENIRFVFSMDELKELKFNIESAIADLALKKSGYVEKPNQE